SGANVAGDPGGLGDTAAAGDWLTERYGGEDAYGAAFGGGAHGAAAQATSGAFAAGQAGHAGHAHAAQGAHASGAPAGVEPALEAALLDDRVAIAEPPSVKDTAVPLRLGPPPSPARHDSEESRGERPAIPEVGGIPIQLPPLEVLDQPDRSQHDREEVLKEHRARVSQIDETLSNFKLGGRVAAAVRGPTVTRFEVEPAPGEKISRFANPSDDLALAMAVGSVRIEAPIPGKSVIGLEVPNAHRELVRFREATEAPSYRRTKARLPLILGKSIDGEMMVGDLAKMPHLLIAGSTGSGKSVAVNTLVSSLLYRFLPTELRFLMIDPKM